MKHRTYASFFDIVQGVKDETGISNLQNFYQSLHSLIVRAERDINPFAGHFIKKRVRYKKGSGAFNGKAIKIPDDYIEAIDVYDRAEPGRAPMETRENVSHILLCNGIVNETAVLSYWATQMDSNGHPFVPYTHFEAVVAFIVWKLYSKRVFQNTGSVNAKKDYQFIYEDFAKAARGSDFFPDENNMTNMRDESHTASMFAVVTDDDCFCACSIIDDNTPPVTDMKIWYWQENSLTQQITEDDVTDEFLSNKQTVEELAFKAGVYFTSSYIGRYGIAIQNGPSTPIGIIDALGTSIRDSVTYKYYPEKSLLVLISKNYITPGTFLLKLT